MRIKCSDPPCCPRACRRPHGPRRSAVVRGVLWGNDDQFDDHGNPAPDHDDGLVVIDPLTSVMGESIDTHRTRGVRFVPDSLARMADRIGSVILGIAHFNKATGTECGPYGRVRAALDLRIRSRRDGRQQQGYDTGQEPAQA